MKAKKTPELTAEQNLPEKVPQPHGGALFSAGVRGNKGGPGRPPDAFRQKARDVLGRKKLLPRLGDIGDGTVMETIECPNCGTLAKTSPLRVQVGAIAELARMGVGAEKGLQESVIQERLELTIQLFEELPDDIRAGCLKRLRAIWKGQQ